MAAAKKPTAKNSQGISKRPARNPGRVPSPTQPGGTAYIPKGPKMVAGKRKPGASTRPKPMPGVIMPKPVKKKRGR